MNELCNNCFQYREQVEGEDFTMNENTCIHDRPIPSCGRCRQACRDNNWCCCCSENTNGNHSWDPEKIRVSIEQAPERKAQCFFWADPDDCDPPHGLDMRSNHDADKVASLKEAFLKNGFDIDYPALVGYPLGNRIQLVSGTHRHLAAKQAKIKIPITLWLQSDIQEMWGTELWDKVIEDIPVKELKNFHVAEGPSRSPYDRVELPSKEITK